MNVKPVMRAVSPPSFPAGESRNRLVEVAKAIGHAERNRLPADDPPTVGNATANSRLRDVSTFRDVANEHGVVVIDLLLKGRAALIAERFDRIAIDLVLAGVYQVVRHAGRVIRSACLSVQPHDAD